MLSRDGITGLVCLALSIGLFMLTFGLPPAAMVPVGPAFYPRVVILLFGLLSVILIVLDLRSAKTVRTGTATVPTAAATGPAPNYRLVLATFVEFGLYIALMPLIGFRISTFLFVLALEVTLEWPHNARHWVVAIVVALATSAVCYFIFQDYLSVLLPRGMWSGM